MEGHEQVTINHFYLQFCQIYLISVNINLTYDGVRRLVYDVHNDTKASRWWYHALKHRSSMNDALMHFIINN